MKKRGKVIVIKSYKLIAIIAVLFLGLLLLASFLSSSLDFESKIAVIPIEGVIGSADDFTESEVSAKQIIQDLESANKDKSIKAIILEINSPGGTVVASEEIANAVKKSKKPVVSLIREVGASGAYWVASASDKIVASRMSVTGSIGVTSSYLEFSKLMEKYGITYNILKSGEYKDTGSPYKELTEDERRMLQNTLDKIYNYFIEQVSINRNITKSQIEKLATGMIYLGEEAKSLGLIDEIGDKETAIKIAKDLANIKEAKIVSYERKKTLMDILSKLMTNISYNVGRGIGYQLFSLSNQNTLSFRL